MKPPALLVVTAAFLAASQAQVVAQTAAPAPAVSGAPAVPATARPAWQAHPVIIINPKDWLPSPSPSPRRRKPLHHKPHATRGPNAVPTPEVFERYDTGTPKPH